MDRVVIDGVEVAVGLSWDIAENGVKKKSAINQVVASAPGMGVGVIRKPKSSNDAQVGLASEDLKGVKSAAAVFADAYANSETNIIGLFNAELAGEKGFWLVAVVDGFVIPGGDSFYNNLNTALGQVRDLMQISSAERSFDTLLASADLLTQFTGSTEVLFSDLVGSSGKNHELRPLSSTSLNVGQLAVLGVALIGIGYFVYNNYGVELGLKEPEYKTVTPAELRQELVDRAEQTLKNGLVGSAEFGVVSNAIYNKLNQIPLFIAGWNVNAVLVGSSGLITVGIERAEGSIYSLMDKAKSNQWEVKVEELTDDLASWVINDLKVDVVNTIPVLPDGSKIRNDLKNLYQLSGFTGYEFSIPAPIINQAEIPPNVDYKNPGHITKMTFNGDGIWDLKAIISTLTPYSTLRLTSLEMQVESGEYSKWTLKGELYEN